jgi:hypothetical protein
MNKIIEVALTGKFGAEAVTNLMEVIGATPNPEMAAEILLGIYVQPELPHTVANAQGLEKTAVHIDYWNSDITYTYDEEVRKHMYIDKDADTSLITMDNYKEYERDYDKGNITSFYLSTGEIKQKRSSCSFGDWLSQDAVAV